MSQKDRDYVPDSASDSNSELYTYYITPSGLSQSFDVCDIHSKSTPAPYRKYVGKRKWGSKKKDFTRNFLRSPRKLTMSNKICRNSQQSATLDPLPPGSPKEIPLVRSTTDDTKLGARFEVIEKESPQELVVRSPDLHEKVVPASKVTTNIVIDPSVLDDVLEFCAVCTVCLIGRLKIWDLGTRTCFASYLTLRGNYCNSGKDFWTPSGKFQSKIQIGPHKITKRNDSMYQCILAGRLIGIG